jgi:cardiolipin synthase
MSGLTIGLAIHILIEVIVRVILRPHREPASRIAWIVVIVTLPVVGILAYILLGETNIGRRRIARMREVLDGLPRLEAASGAEEAQREVGVPEKYRHLFDVGHSISGFTAVGGNSANLMADSNATIDEVANWLLRHRLWNNTTFPMQNHNCPNTAFAA